MGLQLLAGGQPVCSATSQAELFASRRSIRRVKTHWMASLAVSIASSLSPISPKAMAAIATAYPSRNHAPTSSQ